MEISSISHFTWALMACHTFDSVFLLRVLPSRGSFHVGISVGSAVSLLTNGFSNLRVCLKFFQSPRSEAHAKNVLKHERSLRLLSVSAPAVIVRLN